jgi:hypothetical protein
LPLDLIDHPRHRSPIPHIRRKRPTIDAKAPQSLARRVRPLGAPIVQGNARSGPAKGGRDGEPQPGRTPGDQYDLILEAKLNRHGHTLPVDLPVERCGYLTVN